MGEASNPFSASVVCTIVLLLFEKTAKKIQISMHARILLQTSIRYAGVIPLRDNLELAPFVVLLFSSRIFFNIMVRPKIKTPEDRHAYLREWRRQKRARTVDIGHAHIEWHSLKHVLGIDSDAELAKLLIEWWVGNLKSNIYMYGLLKS